MKFSLRIATLSLALLLLAGPVTADQFQEWAAVYEEGRAAYKNGDYATALRLWQPLAEKGNADAQFSVGAVLEAQGKGGTQASRVAALKWYQLAAEQGHAFAQQVLGTFYEHGATIPQDYVQALMWYNLSASSGETKVSEKRDGIAAKMTPDQLVEAEKLTREWRPKTWDELKGQLPQ